MLQTTKVENACLVFRDLRNKRVYVYNVKHTDNLIMLIFNAIIQIVFRTKVSSPQIQQ